MFAILLMSAKDYKSLTGLHPLDGGEHYISLALALSTSSPLYTLSFSCLLQSHLDFRISLLSFDKRIYRDFFPHPPIFTSHTSYLCCSSADCLLTFTHTHTHVYIHMHIYQPYRCSLFLLAPTLSLELKPSLLRAHYAQISLLLPLVVSLVLSLLVCCL